MRMVLPLVTICAALLGVFIVGPYLIEVSPWLAGILVVILLVVVSYFKVSEREKALDQQASQRRFPRGPKP